MDTRPVLVSTCAEDPTADLVITELNRRRVPVVRLDPARDLPGSVTLRATLGVHGWEGTLQVMERTADLAHVRALYRRRPSPYPQPGTGQAERWAAQETRRGLDGVLASLPGCLYLSHPQAIAAAEYKPAQLAAAVRFGLDVPPTLITSDPAAARSFIAAQPTVYKPLHAGNYEVDGRPAGIWTAPVDPDEIDQAVTRCPHLFQAQVPKAADVRAIVIGDQALCARITAPPGTVDWRARYADLRYEPVTCPPTVHHALRAFLTSFHLAYGAFDFAVTPDGSWRFLECNPNGQWAWLEEAADLPITEAIADLLENGRTT